jgi:penicillin-binding protein 1A
VFAQLVADLGATKMDQIAHAMGITSRLDGNPAEVIGGLSHCCTMLEMADAYATLAAGGVHRSPTIVSRVVFPDGSSVNLGDPKPKRVFTDGEAYTATKILETVITSGTGVTANFGCPAAGKTGTAENLDNAWFVGYTPKLSTAVWVGYPQSNNLSMGPNGFGGTLAAPIWKSYMVGASNGYCGDFPPPTTPWSGTAYFGAHSSGGSASRYGYGNSTGYGPGTSSGSGTGTGTNTTSNSYNNPTLFSQPTPSGTGGAAPPNQGNANSGQGSPGNSGNAPGHGGGGGNKTH